MILSKSDAQHNNALPLCWVSHFIYCYAECHYAEYRYAECHYAECHGAKLTDWGKHARLLQYGINYNRKKSFTVQATARVDIRNICGQIY
jgi:hypothetical protein